MRRQWQSPTSYDFGCSTPTDSDDFPNCPLRSEVSDLVGADDIREDGIREVASRVGGIRADVPRRVVDEQVGGQNQVAFRPRAVDYPDFLRRAVGYLGCLHLDGHLVVEFPDFLHLVGHRGCLRLVDSPDYLRPADFLGPVGSQGEFLGRGVYQQMDDFARNRLRLPPPLPNRVASMVSCPGSYRVVLLMVVPLMAVMAMAVLPKVVSDGLTGVLPMVEMAMGVLPMVEMDGLTDVPMKVVPLMDVMAKAVLPMAVMDGLTGAPVKVVMRVGSKDELMGGLKDELMGGS